MSDLLDSTPQNDGASGTPLPFRIEGWTVVPQAHELVRSGEAVHVEPKPMEVLVHLAARAGEAVSRDELLETLWPGVFVTEHALNRCVSRLRKLFDDDPREPRVIETIPKAGYRLIAPVEWLPGDSAAAPLEALDLHVPTFGAATPTSARAERPLLAALVLLGLIVLVSVAAITLSAQRPTDAPTTRPLTVAPGIETEAAWSPDGTRLVYVHRGEDGAEGLYLQDPRTGTSLRLTEGATDNSPAWSPDGTRIAFVRCAPSPCAVYSVAALGGAVRRLTEAPLRSMGMSFMPDGQALAIAVPDSVDGRVGIALLDLERGEQLRLTDPPAGFADILPRISPDGAWIAFQRRGRAGTDLYRVPVDGGGTRRLTTDGRPLAGHTWTADGRALLFSSARSGVYALWRVSAEGGDPEPVRGPAVRDPGGPALAGERLVVEDWLFEINLWKRVGDGPAERIVASTLWDKQPALSPDASRIAFISNRTGPPELWTATAEGTELLRLTTFEGPAVEHPRFSPDGEQIVFEARTEGHADLWMVAAEGGVPRRLTTHPADEVVPRFSRDGQTLYFGSDRNGRWQVWRMPTAGGAADVVTDGIVAEETADGALLVARREEGGLWRIEAGEAEQISPGPLPGDWASWTLTDQGILSLNRPAGRLALLDPQTGLGSNTDGELGTLMEIEGTFAASADGRTVVWAQVDRVKADLLLVEPFE